MKAQRLRLLLSQENIDCGFFDEIDVKSMFCQSLKNIKY